MLRPVRAQDRQRRRNIGCRYGRKSQVRIVNRRNRGLGLVSGVPWVEGGIPSPSLPRLSKFDRTCRCAGGRSTFRPPICLAIQPICCRLYQAIVRKNDRANVSGRDCCCRDAGGHISQQCSRRDEGRDFHRRWCKQGLGALKGG